MHTALQIPTIAVSNQKPLTVSDFACLCLALNNLPTDQTKSTVIQSKSTATGETLDKFSIEIRYRM